MKYLEKNFLDLTKIQPSSTDGSLRLSALCAETYYAEPQKPNNYK